MRISDWSSDVCSSDLVVPDIVEHIELIVAQCRVFDDESFEELAESAKIILDLKAEINVSEMELRIIERHQLISAVGEQTDPIFCPFQGHHTSIHSGMSRPDGKHVHVTGMFNPRKNEPVLPEGKAGKNRRPWPCATSMDFSCQKWADPSNHINHVVLPGPRYRGFRDVSIVPLCHRLSR